MTAEVLSQGQLKRLKEHKYKASGSSMLEPFMQVFWRWLVEQIPMSWAPNSITLVGLALNVGTTLILAFYSPDGKQEAPWWSYMLCSVGLFIYQSLDAIDGKQARRTQTASPLGELFDHGCDSLSTAFVMTGCCVALRLADWPYLFLFEICLAEFCFYLAHWQTYVTGELKFGYLDVTEGQFVVMTIYTISAICPAVWDMEAPMVGVQVKVLVAIGSLVPSVLMIIRTVGNILQGGVGKNKSTVAGTSTIFPAVPIAIIVFLQFVIAQKTSIYQDHPVLYLLSFGLVTAKITNGLVIAHMSKNEMFLVDFSLIGPAMLFLNQYFNCVINEYLLLWIMAIFCSWDLVKCSVDVCNQICESMNIYCFNITDKRPSGNRAVNGKRS